MKEPSIKPSRPYFASGPCAKRPGWSVDALSAAFVGRSHRSTFGKARLAEVFERSRVLQAVAGRDPALETTLAVLRATKQMSSDFETARVLLAVAERQDLIGPARDLYIEAAQRLGHFEQDRALAALSRRKG